MTNAAVRVVVARLGKRCRAALWTLVSRHARLFFLLRVHIASTKLQHNTALHAYLFFGRPGAIVLCGGYFLSAALAIASAGIL